MAYNDQRLHRIYYDESHPASYGNANRLYEAVKHHGYRLKDIKNWLETQETYTLHKQPNEQVVRPRVVVSDKYQQLDADTINMEWYSKFNEGYAYILVAIDIFTRYAWTRPLYTLTGAEMKDTLLELFKDKPIDKLRTDSGSEFISVELRNALLDELNIKIFYTRNETKANYAERFIKTLKGKISKIMFQEQSYTWVGYLESVTNSYNKAYHRSIKMTPEKAMIKGDRYELWVTQYSVKKTRTRKLKSKPPKKLPSIYRFDTGDVVRLARYKTAFARHYDEKWTHELYTVVDRSAQRGVAQYRIKSFKNEIVDGRFYHEELERVKVDENTTYKVQDIEKSRKRRGKLEYYVKWLGWPKDYNTWIPSENLVNIPQRLLDKRREIAKKKKKKKKKKVDEVVLSEGEEEEEEEEAVVTEEVPKKKAIIKKKKKRKSAASRWTRKKKKNS